MDCSQFKGITGTIFVNYNVIGESYHEMLEKEMFPQMKRQPWFRCFIFQQNRARSHTATEILMLLPGIFGGYVISNRNSRIFNKG